LYEKTFVVIISTAILVSTIDLDDIVRGSSFFAETNKTHLAKETILKHDHLLKIIQDAFVSFLYDQEIPR
jgi:hypothetical protein